MKKNMGSTDSLIRIALAIVFIALYFTNIISGTLGIILIVLSVVFVITGIIGICPLYMPFGISTCKKETK